MAFFIFQKEGERMKGRREIIEKRIRDARLKDYEVAYEIGISHYTFCVWKRDLNDVRFKKVNDAIDRLVRGLEKKLSSR